MANNDLQEMLKRFRYPLNSTSMQPITGKQEGAVSMCKANLVTLQELQREADSAYTKFDISVKEARSSVGNSINPNIPASSVTAQYLMGRIDMGVSVAVRLQNEINKVLNPNLPDYVKMAYTPSVVDFGGVTQAFNTYYTKLKDIEKRAAKIKEDNKPEIKEATVSSANTEYSLENKTFLKSMYDISIQMILPDNTQNDITQYITDILYSFNADNMVMPIYSVKMKMPATLYDSIRKYFEGIKWYITVKLYTKTSDTSQDQFAIPSLIKDFEELVAIDPTFSPGNDDSNRPEGVLPIYTMKMDFVSAKGNALNSIVKARVFSNCKLIDVISALCSQVKQEYESTGNVDSSKEIKYTISPPDNTQTYEQIIIKPGSFTATLHALQREYGVYKTGIQVLFDGNHNIKDTNGVKPISYLTITDKGGTAPATNNITDALFEVVDPKYVKNMIHETGYLINNDTSSVTVRTFEPYHLVKTNSDRLSRGDSVRVMSTSQNSASSTVCDNPNDFSTYNQRFYYSKFDNPYALTQLQDNIRERNQMLTIEARDIDIFTFNANLNYQVKFYSRDDETGSGTYRLKKYAAYFGFTRSGVKSRVETSAVFEFGNIPELRENGVTAPRKTYAEKVGSTNKNASNSTTLKGATSSGTGGGFTSNSSNTPSVPFKTNFRNKKDYLGNTVPETIPASYKMSQQTTFEDVYVTQTGTDLYKGNGLANNFAYFINAQRFASEILDPLFNSEGKSKLVDFYKYETDGSYGASAHLVALAADVSFNKSGDELIKSFIKISNMGLDFDQLILQGDGSSWKYIHIGKNMNETNRKQVILSPTSVNNDYKVINKALTEEDVPKLKITEFRKYF